MAEMRLAHDYVDTFVGPEPLKQYSAETIIDTLGALRIESSDYFLLGGANLALRGIVDTTPDIDMLVSDKGFGVIAQELGAELRNPPLRAQLEGATNRSVWVKSRHTGMPISATTSLGNGYYPMSFESHRPSTELVSGIPCINIDDIVASKTALAREKDVTHLKQMASFLGRTITLPNVVARFSWDS